jgi:hypothetical protein
MQQNFKIYENFGHRIHAKGRCMGGYVLGIANGISQYTSVLKTHSEYCIIKFVRYGITIHICFVYISPNSNLTFQEAFDDIDIDENHCIILGDMNARIGPYQNVGIMVNPTQDNTRPSKDKIVNTRGRNLVRYLNRNFVQVINGTTQSNDQGEFTFTNKNGSSVIDLCLTSPAISSFLDLAVINSVESCHFPIKVELGVPTAKRSHKVNKIVWNPNEEEHFNTLLCNSITTVGIEPTRVEDLNMFIISSADICKMNKRRTLGDTHIISHPRWFDEKCLEYKKKTNKCLRLFRNADNSNQESSICKYLDARRSYKNLREAKKNLYLSQLDSNLTNVKNFRRIL